MSHVIYYFISRLLVEHGFVRTKKYQNKLLNIHSKPWIYATNIKENIFKLVKS